MTAEIFCLASDLDAVRVAADRLFASTALDLGGLLPPSADIRHIGATAIPGCLTKGDLDIVVRIELADFSMADQCLASRFARNTGSITTDDFSAFVDSSTTPHLGIQLS